MANACFDFGFTSSVKSKLAFLINKKCDDSNRNETINILLDDLIARFHITKQKEAAELPVEFYQVNEYSLLIYFSVFLKIF